MREKKIRQSCKAKNSQLAEILPFFELVLKAMVFANEIYNLYLFVPIMPFYIYIIISVSHRSKTFLKPMLRNLGGFQPYALRNTISKYENSLRILIIEFIKTNIF